MEYSFCPHIFVLGTIINKELFVIITSQISFIPTLIRQVKITAIKQIICLLRFALKKESRFLPSCLQKIK